MKKTNKTYAAPKAEVIELSVNRDFMESGWGIVSMGDSGAPTPPKKNF